MILDNNYIIDDIYGERLLINKKADQTELADNIRVAKESIKKIINEVIEKLRT